MCGRARLRRLYLQVPSELHPPPLRTRMLDTVHAVRRAMFLVMPSPNLSRPLWIGESSTSISVLCSITKFLGRYAFDSRAIYVARTSSNAVIAANLSAENHVKISFASSVHSKEKRRQ